MTLKNQTIGILTAVAIIACLVVGGRRILRYKLEGDRADWKTATLPRLAELSFDNEEIAGELKMLKANRAAGKYRNGPVSEFS